MHVNSAKIAKYTADVPIARFFCARSATTSSISILPHKQTKTGFLSIIKDLEFAKNVKNKNAQHNVLTVNNFCAVPAAIAYTKKVQGRNTSDKVRGVHQNSLGLAKPKALAPALTLRFRKEEKVSPLGKIPQTLIISQKIILTIIFKKLQSREKNLTQATPSTRNRPTTRQRIWIMNRKEEWVNICLWIVQLPPPAEAIKEAAKAAVPTPLVEALPAHTKILIITTEDSKIIIMVHTQVEGEFSKNTRKLKLVVNRTEKLYLVNKEILMLSHLNSSVNQFPLINYSIDGD